MKGPLRYKRCPLLPFLLVVVSCLLLLPAFAQSQVGGLRVRVTNAADEQPIFQAEVRLFSQGHGNDTFRGLTDGTGTVIIGGVVRGNYDLVVSAPGYYEAREAVDVPPVTLTSVDIRLKPKAEKKAEAGGPENAVSAIMLGVPNNARKDYDKGVKELKQDPASAAASFQRAIQKYPKYAQAYAMLGLSYERQKHDDDAIKAYQHAIELDPSYGAPHVLMGELYVREKRYSDAEAELLKAISLDPAAWDAPFELARCYYHLGKIDKALEYAKRARDVPNAPSSTRLLLVDLYMKNNDRQAALKELQEFAKADPQSPYMPRVRQLISDLHK